MYYLQTFMQENILNLSRQIVNTPIATYLEFRVIK